MKPSIPKGTRDFTPEQVYKRKYIFDTIEEVFKQFGYAPIETPTMELLSTLTGKYGDEGDQLLFKVLNNGDFLSKVDSQILEQKDSKKALKSLSKRGLRYDLTIPFARFIVMHQNDISFPFKRYQIQPVWRADRPQKGRYQEFYQCDVDVVGSDSLVYEAELLQMYDQVFGKLNLKSTIKINNRKVLYGIAEVAGVADKFIDFTVAIDKLDKIGMEGVVRELTNRDIPESAITIITDILGDTSLDKLKPILASSETGALGIQELEEVFGYLENYERLNTIEFDVTLARGLSYYTGCIFEVASDDVTIGSIGGGGRYDDLTATFGMKNTSGVGVSFGAARIYDCMVELDLFPVEVAKEIDLIFLPLDDEAVKYSFSLVTQLRLSGIPCDMYPESAKLKKQMKYANQRGIKHVSIIGDQEMQTGNLILKNMETGDQKPMTVKEIITLLKS